ncbi:MAG: sigma-54-dependent Fis family transcriptional regulator [Candidatus Latescibacteria bacterium]|nr:sigma-54-dependent Fis family transcriptional regulator [Candidatus Latescibacterota bacterium]
MGERINLLVVDDDEMFRTVISKELRKMGFDVTAAADGEEALTRIDGGGLHVVLLDIKMPGMDGLAVLQTVRERAPATEVVMLTGHGTVENAIAAMKSGAYDYLTKPCELDQVEVTVRKAYEKSLLTRQNVTLQYELSRCGCGQAFGFIGHSPALQTVLDMIGKVAMTDSTVLIRGESGVGKELVARAIHTNSLRAKSPFVVIDCTSLQENLLESELFGHERGAYTGAVSLKHGLFEVATGGTVFLDEITEISPTIQAKLLRVIETKTFRRLGGTKDIQVDVRVLASTNKDLEALVSQGKFREDLFYRLNVISIVIPPLRDRRDDIPLLAAHFAAHSRISGKNKKRISPDAIHLLCQYTWPGNVRELENVIERAMILSAGDVIAPQDLPETLRAASRLRETEPNGSLQPLRQIEDQYIEQVLQAVSGNKRQAARILGISERHLHRRLRNGEAPSLPLDEEVNQ